MGHLYCKLNSLMFLFCSRPTQHCQWILWTSRVRPLFISKNQRGVTNWGWDWKNPGAAISFSSVPVWFTQGKFHNERLEWINWLCQPYSGQILTDCIFTHKGWLTVIGQWLECLRRDSHHFRVPLHSAAPSIIKVTNFEWDARLL